MKKLKHVPAFLWIIVLIQSALIFSSFKTNEKDDATLQSYRIEKKYSSGTYFYVLIDNGEAKAFIKE